MNEFVKGHEKKLKGLAKSSSVPFTHKDTVVNITALFNEVMDITKTVKTLIKPRDGFFPRSGRALTPRTYKQTHTPPWYKGGWRVVGTPPLGFRWVKIL